MSARRLGLRFTRDADRDIEDILLFTRRAWGDKQQIVDGRALTSTFRRLRDFPDVGQVRNELFVGCRSLQLEQHVVYYHQLSPTELVIVRVLHVRQDAEAIVVLSLS